MFVFYGFYVYLRRVIGETKPFTKNDATELCIDEWRSLSCEEQEKWKRGGQSNDAFGFETFVGHRYNKEKRQRNNAILNDALRAWCAMSLEEKQSYNDEADKMTEDQRHMTMLICSFRYEIINKHV